MKCRLPHGANGCSFGQSRPGYSLCPSYYCEEGDLLSGMLGSRRVKTEALGASSVGGIVLRFHNVLSPLSSVLCRWANKDSDQGASVGSLAGDCFQKHDFKVHVFPLCFVACSQVIHFFFSSSLEWLWCHAWAEERWCMNLNESWPLPVVSSVNGHGTDVVGGWDPGSRFNSAVN